MAALVLYTRGLGRSFNLDASRTVAQFIAVPSWKAVLTQDRFNNHPLFSVLDHLVYLWTGSRAEWVLRLAPIVCGAAVVALLAAAVAGRFGTIAGHVAGCTLAVNVLTLRQFREVRGYALVTLAAVASTLALLRLLGPRPHVPPPFPPQRGLLLAGYGISLAIAIGSHLFALALIPLHALLVVAKGDRLQSWAVACAPAAAIGLAIQVPGIVDGLSAPPKRAFDAGFPLALGANLLGGASLPGLLVLVAAGWMVLRGRRWVRWCAGGAALIAATAWVAAPVWLDARFFIWLVPAAAVGAGAAVARWPRLLPVAIASIALQLAVVGPSLGRSEIPNRAAAQLLRQGESAGDRVCAIGRTGPGLLAYVGGVPSVWDATHLANCDLAVEADGPSPDPLLKVACAQFAYVLSLPAQHPGAAFSDRPPPQPRKGPVRTWVPTGLAGPCRT